MARAESDVRIGQEKKGLMQWINDRFPLDFWASRRSHVCPGCF